MSASIAASFDFARLPEGFVDDPFPFYAALREHAPVRRVSETRAILSRHADLERVYKDTQAFSSDKKVEFGAKYGPSPLLEHHTTSLVFNDPPLHTRVRRLINGALTARVIADMEAGVSALVDRLLDEAADKGEIDAIEAFAGAIPVEVIGNLLDVPREERGPLRAWSLAILGALEPVLTPAQVQAGNDAVTDFLAYLRDLVARRRARPGDPARDVLTRLIQGEADGERLTEVELLQNCIFILNAGHETTTNLIGNGIDLLLRHPDERKRLTADPALMRTAVEDMLRMESPNQLGNRITTVAVAFGDEVLPEGTQITLVIGAANRDPAVFRDPDRFDVARAPNRHLAFASGPHQCVGMNVARLEGRIALGKLLDRFPAFTRAGAAVRSRRVRFRGFTTLPIRLA